MGLRDPPEPHRRNGHTRPPTGGPGPFSLADPAIAQGILAAAGFIQVSFTDVHEPVYYGQDTATAFDNVLRLREYKDLLANLDTATAEQARTRLRATLAAHNTDKGPVTGILSGMLGCRSFGVGFPDEREVRFDDRGEDRCRVQRPDIPHVPGPGLTHFFPSP